VDTALGLQSLGHSVDIYTSHHNPAHCFDETRDGEYVFLPKYIIALILVVRVGTLNVHHIVPPFPRSARGKFHILFAHARQLHLTVHLLLQRAPRYDVYFVDQPERSLWAKFVPSSTPGCGKTVTINFIKMASTHNVLCDKPILYQAGDNFCHRLPTRIFQKTVYNLLVLRSPSCC
jgi:hypothetical protein